MDLQREETELEIEQQQQQGNEDRWKLFRPFPRQTTTLLAGPSFLGKSTYVRKIVEHQHLFFQDPVVRLWVVNCNKSVTFVPLEEPKDDSKFRRPLAQLLQRTWEDFDIEELNEGDVLLIDDLQKVTQHIREIVNAATHHLALGHCFVITHSILGSRQYELLNLVHRIALFCSSASVTNLASYILSTRIFDPDLKTRLKEAVGAAQRSREVLVLELSALPESVQPYQVACSHLLRLIDPKSGFAVVYPYPSRVEMYEEEADNLLDVEVKNQSDASRNLPGAGEFVRGSFLILRPELVASVKTKKTEDQIVKRSASASKRKRKREDGNEGGSNNGDSSEDEDNDDDDACCIDKDEAVWNKTVLQMESDVENFLPAKQWRSCKSLLYEILHNPAICLLNDGRRIKLHDRPVVVILVDYLSAATRRDAPTERKSKANTPEFKGFRHVTAALLSYFAPKTLFKNRLVLPGKSETRMSPPYNSAGKVSHVEKRKDNVKKKQKKMKKKKNVSSRNRSRIKGSKRDGRRRKFKTQRDRKDRKRAYSGEEEEEEEEEEENQKEDSAFSTLSADDIDFGDLDFSALH
jgi:hypothetical protein